MFIEKFLRSKKALSNVNEEIDIFASSRETFCCHAEDESGSSHALSFKIILSCIKLSNMSEAKLYLRFCLLA